MAEPDTTAKFKSLGQKAGIPLVEAMERMNRFTRAINDNCKACGKRIRIQIFRGTGWCCDDCRKALQKEA